MIFVKALEKGFGWFGWMGCGALIGNKQLQVASRGWSYKKNVQCSTEINSCMSPYRRRMFVLDHSRRPIFDLQTIAIHFDS